MYSNAKRLFNINYEFILKFGIALQWRHNEHDGVSNHRCPDVFFQTFVQAQIKENI